MQEAFKQKIVKNTDKRSLQLVQSFRLPDIHLSN